MQYRIAPHRDTLDRVRVASFSGLAALQVMTLGGPFQICEKEYRPTGGRFRE
jgi:hypothetical protein